MKFSNTFYLIVKLYYLLSPLRRKQLFMLLVVSVASALLEILSLAFVMPLLSIVFEPTSASGYNFFGIILSDFRSQLAWPLATIFGSLFLLVSLVAGLSKIFTLWFGQKLSSWIGSDLSCGIYRNIIYQPYQYHIDANSSSIINLIGPQVIRSVLAVNAILTAISSFFLVVFIVSSLFFINAKISGLVFGVLLINYCLLLYFLRKKMTNNGRIIVSSEKLQLKILQERSIRDLILGESMKIFLDKYTHSDKILRSKRAQNMFLSSVPRYAIETIVMILISIIVILASSNSVSNTISFGMIGFLFFAYQRLMPSLQQIFASSSAVASYRTDLESIVELFDNTKDNSFSDTMNIEKELLSLENYISFRAVSFAYWIHP